MIDKPWDFVIVDGPDGFDRSSPGRQIPVAWATRLARRAVYVHDYERKWETAVCEKYLGKPSEVVGAQGRNDRCLGVFRFPEDNGGNFYDPDRERPQEDRLPTE